jgi:hypothetical protein
VIRREHRRPGGGGFVGIGGYGSLHFDQSGF